MLVLIALHVYGLGKVTLLDNEWLTSNVSCIHVRTASRGTEGTGIACSSAELGGRLHVACALLEISCKIMRESGDSYQESGKNLTSFFARFLNISCMILARILHGPWKNLTWFGRILHGP